MFRARAGVEFRLLIYALNRNNVEKIYDRVAIWWIRHKLKFPQLKKKDGYSFHDWHERSAQHAAAINSFL